MVLENNNKCHHDDREGIRSKGRKTDNKQRNEHRQLLDDFEQNRDVIQFVFYEGFAINCPSGLALVWEKRRIENR